LTVNQIVTGEESASRSHFCRKNQSDQVFFYYFCIAQHYFIIGNCYNNRICFVPFLIRQFKELDFNLGSGQCGGNGEDKFPVVKGHNSFYFVIVDFYHAVFRMQDRFIALEYNLVWIDEPSLLDKWRTQIKSKIEFYRSLYFHPI